MNLREETEKAQMKKKIDENFSNNLASICWDLLLLE